MFFPPPVTFPLASPVSGSAAAPAYGFASEASGSFLQAAGKLSRAVAGTERDRLSSSGLDLGAGQLLLGSAIGSVDVGAKRGAASRLDVTDGSTGNGALAVRNGTGASALGLIIGSDRDSGFWEASDQLTVTVAGFDWMRWDRGTGYTAIRDRMYLVSGAVAPGANSPGLHYSANKVAKLVGGTGGDGGTLEFPKSTAAPAAGAANTGRLYVVDNGAGKMQLEIIFPTGVAQVIATEP